MGQKNFIVVGRGSTITRAWITEVLKAIKLYGDDGYTGTIAEKWEYVQFDLRGLARAGAVARAVLECDDRQRFDSFPSEIHDTLHQMYEFAHDKWAPAVALELDAADTLDGPTSNEKAYLFFGSAPY